MNGVLFPNNLILIAFLLHNLVPCQGSLISELFDIVTLKIFQPERLKTAIGTFKHDFARSIKDIHDFILYIADVFTHPFTRNPPDVYPNYDPPWAAAGTPSTNSDELRAVTEEMSTLFNQPFFDLRSATADLIDLDNKADLNAGDGDLDASTLNRDTVDENEETETVSNEIFPSIKIEELDIENQPSSDLKGTTNEKRSSGSLSSETFGSEEIPTDDSKFGKESSRNLPASNFFSLNNDSKLMEDLRNLTSQIEETKNNFTIVLSDYEGAINLTKNINCTNIKDEIDTTQFKFTGKNHTLEASIEKANTSNNNKVNKFFKGDETVVSTLLDAFIQSIEMNDVNLDSATERKFKSEKRSFINKLNKMENKNKKSIEYKNSDTSFVEIPMYGEKTKTKVEKSDAPYEQIFSKGNVLNEVPKFEFIKDKVISNFGNSYFGYSKEVSTRENIINKTKEMYNIPFRNKPNSLLVDDFVKKKFVPEKLQKSLSYALKIDPIKILPSVKDNLNKTLPLNTKIYRNDTNSSLDLKDKKMIRTNCTFTKTTSNISRTESNDEKPLPGNKVNIELETNSKKIRTKHDSKPKRRPWEINATKSLLLRSKSSLKRPNRSLKLLAKDLTPRDSSHPSNGQRKNPRSQNNGVTNSTSARILSKIKIKDQQSSKSSKKVTLTPAKSKKTFPFKSSQNQRPVLTKKSSIKTNSTRNFKTGTTVRKRMSLMATPSVVYRLPTTPFDIFKNIVQSKWALLNNADEESVGLPPSENDEDETAEGIKEADDTLLADSSQFMDYVQPVEDSQFVDDFDTPEDTEIEDYLIVDETRIVNDTLALDDPSTLDLKIEDPTQKTNVSFFAISTLKNLNSPVTEGAQTTSDQKLNNNDTSSLIIGENSVFNESHPENNVHSKESSLTEGSDVRFPTVSDTHFLTPSDFHHLVALETRPPTAPDAQLPFFSDSSQSIVSDGKGGSITMEDTQAIDALLRDFTSTSEDGQIVEDGQPDVDLISSNSGSISNGSNNFTLPVSEENDEENPENVRHHSVEKDESNGSVLGNEDNGATEDLLVSQIESSHSKLEEEEEEEEEKRDIQENFEAVSKFYPKNTNERKEDSFQTESPEIYTSTHWKKVSKNPSYTTHIKTLTTTKLVRPIKTYGFEEKPDILGKYELNKSIQTKENRLNTVPVKKKISTSEYDSSSMSPFNFTSRDYSLYNLITEIPSKLSSKISSSSPKKKMTKVPSNIRLKSATKLPRISHPKLPSNHHSKPSQSSTLEIPFKIPINPPSILKFYPRNKTRATLRPHRVLSKALKTSKFPSKTFSKSPLDLSTKYQKPSHQFSFTPSTKLLLKYTPLPYSRPRLTHPTKFSYRARATLTPGTTTTEVNEITFDSKSEINSDFNSDVGSQTFSSLTSSSAATSLNSSPFIAAPIETTDKLKSIIQANLAQKNLEEEEEEYIHDQNLQTYKEEINPDEVISEITEENHESSQEEEEATEDGDNITKSLADLDPLTVEDITTKVYTDESIELTTRRSNFGRKPFKSIKLIPSSHNPKPQTESIFEPYSFYPTQDFRKKSPLYFQSPEFINSAFKYIEPGSNKVSINTPDSTYSSDTKIISGVAFKPPLDLNLHNSLKKKSRIKKGPEKIKAKPRPSSASMLSTTVPKKSKTKSFERIVQMNWDLLNVQDYEYEIADEDNENETTPSVSSDDQFPAEIKRRERKSYSPGKNQIPDEEEKPTPIDFEALNNELMNDGTFALKPWQVTTEEYYYKPIFKKLPLHNLAFAITLNPVYSGQPIKKQKLLISPDVTTESLLPVIGKSKSHFFSKQEPSAQNLCNEDFLNSFVYPETTSTENTVSILFKEKLPMDNQSSPLTTAESQHTQEITTQNPCNPELTAEERCNQGINSSSRYHQEISTADSHDQAITSEQLKQTDTDMNVFPTVLCSPTEDSLLVLRDENAASIKQQHATFPLTYEMYPETNQCNITRNFSTNWYIIPQKPIEPMGDGEKMLTLRPRYNAYGVRLPPRYYDEIRTVYKTTRNFRKEPTWIKEPMTTESDKTNEEIPEVEVTPQQRYTISDKNYFDHEIHPKREYPSHNYHSRIIRPSKYFMLPDNIPVFEFPGKEPKPFHSSKAKLEYFYDENTSGYHDNQEKDASAYFQKLGTISSATLNAPRDELIEPILNTPRKILSGLFKEKEIINFYDDKPDIGDKSSYESKFLQGPSQKSTGWLGEKLIIPIYPSEKLRHEVAEDILEFSTKVIDDQNQITKVWIPRKGTTQLPTIREMRRLKIRSSTKYPKSSTIRSKKKQLLGSPLKRPKEQELEQHNKPQIKETTVRYETEENVAEDFEDEVQAPEAEILTYFSDNKFDFQ